MNSDLDIVLSVWVSMAFLYVAMPVRGRAAQKNAPGAGKAVLAYLSGIAVFLLACFALRKEWTAAAYVLLWSALALGMVSVAFCGYGLRVMRRTNGWLHPLSGALLLPYLLPTWLFHAWRRAQSGPATEIAPNVYLGGYPWGRGPWRAVLDMTCEYPMPSAPKGAAYLNIPCVDGVPVIAADLAAGSQFVEAHRAAGPVLIHCAIGRYRSARVVAQWLQDFQGMTEQDAWRLMRQKRPLVRPPKHLKLD